MAEHDKLRLQSNQRVELSDMQFLVEQASAIARNNVSALMIDDSDAAKRSYVLSGFDAVYDTGVTDSIVTVTLGKAITVDLTAPGTPLYGQILSDSPNATLDTTISGAAGTYTVEVKFEFSDGTLATRYFWDAGTSAETSASINTRYLSDWDIQSVSGTTATAGWLKICEVTWNGAAITAITPTRNFFFEGQEAGLASYTIASFDQTHADRAQYGVTNFRDFVQAMCTLMAQIMGGTAKWYEVPAQSLYSIVNSNVTIDGVKTFNHAPLLDEGIDLKQMTAPSTPAADRIAIYAESNSATEFNQLKCKDDLGYVHKLAKPSYISRDFPVSSSVVAGDAVTINWAENPITVTGSYSSSVGGWVAGAPISITAGATMNAKKVLRLTNSKFVIVWGWVDATPTFSVMAVVGDITSGTTITYGTPLTISASSAGARLVAEVVPGSSSTFVVAYGKVDSTLQSTACSVSGNTITAGTEFDVLVGGTMTAKHDIKFLNSTKFVIAYEDTARSATSTYMQILGISGLTISSVVAEYEWASTLRSAAGMINLSRVSDNYFIATIAADTAAVFGPLCQGFYTDLASSVAPVNLPFIIGQTEYGISMIKSITLPDGTIVVGFSGDNVPLHIATISVTSALTGSFLTHQSVKNLTYDYAYITNVFSKYDTASTSLDFYLSTMGGNEFSLMYQTETAGGAPRELQIRRLRAFRNGVELVGDAYTKNMSSPFTITLYAFTEIAKNKYVLAYKIQAEKITSQVVQCMTVDGVSVSTSADTPGNLVEVATGGIVGGFSSLSPGEMYYVSSSTIGKTPGPYKLGRAISATEIKLELED